MEAQTLLGRTLFLSMAVATSACSTTTKARDVSMNADQTITQLELQEELQRFAGDFAAKLADASLGLVKSESPQTRELAIRQLLLYQSAALDIATGAMPEVGLLDMVVFVRLTRSVFQRHWLPQFGSEGQMLLKAFDQAQVDVEKVEDRVLTPAQRQRLTALIDRWLAQNPELVRVETIRFPEFSRVAGNVAEAQETRGIFNSIRSATRSADEAVLLGERFRFLSIRMPFLLRLQAQVGVSDITSDLLNRLDEAEMKLQQLNSMQPFVADLTRLSVETRTAVQESRLLIDELHPLLERLPQPAVVADRLSELTALSDKGMVTMERLAHVMDQAAAILPKDPAATAAQAERQVDHLMRKGALYLVLVGLAWSLVFWGGYAAATAINRAGRAQRTSGPRRILHLRPRH